MIISYEIYWSDLSEEAQNRLVSDGFEADENSDMAPLAIIDQESTDDNNNT
jgi:hypothetical protein